MGSILQLATSVLTMGLLYPLVISLMDEYAVPGMEPALMSRLVILKTFLGWTVYPNLRSVGFLYSNKGIKTLTELNNLGIRERNMKDRVDCCETHGKLERGYTFGRDCKKEESKN